MKKKLTISEIYQGLQVDMTCSNYGCEGVSITVTLDEEIPIHEDFLKSLQDGCSIGRFGPFNRNFIIKGFKILGDTCECPNCKTVLEDAIIVSKKKNGVPIIFSSESVPA